MFEKVSCEIQGGNVVVVVVVFSSLIDGTKNRSWPAQLACFCFVHGDHILLSILNVHFHGVSKPDSELSFMPEIYKIELFRVHKLYIICLSSFLFF